FRLWTGTNPSRSAAFAPRPTGRAAVDRDTSAGSRRPNLTVLGCSRLSRDGFQERLCMHRPRALLFVLEVAERVRTSVQHPQGPPGPGSELLVGVVLLAEA